MTTSTSEPVGKTVWFDEGKLSDWGRHIRQVTFQTCEDGLEIHQLDADLESLARSLGISLDNLAQLAGRHFSADSMTPSRPVRSSEELNEIVNDEIQAFRG